MNYENVPARNWQQWSQENDAVILDVREPNEWALGTLPNATKLSMRDLPTRLHELDRSKPVLVVCRTGSRSAQVAAWLSFNGFQKVANMAGGVVALGMRA